MPENIGIKSICIISNCITWGLPPDCSEEVEQHFTLKNDGQYWLTRYVYGDGWGKYNVKQKLHGKLFNDSAKKILGKIEYILQHDMILVSATDSGSCEMKITFNDNTEQTIRSDLTNEPGPFFDFDEYIRNELGMRDLWLFDGKLSEEEETNFSETLQSSYEMLMERLAKPITERMVDKVKRKLQKCGRESNMMLSDEDSGLKNVWDEFCAQIQGEQAWMIDAYEETVESIISNLLEAFPEEDKMILWTQTPEYEEWSCGIDVDEDDYADVLKLYYDLDSISEYLLNEVENAASNYSNKRIEKYLDI